MKILYITTIGSTMNFFKQYIQELTESGHEVDIACNNKIRDVPPIYNQLKCNIYTINYSRSPLRYENLKAINQIKKTVNDWHYDIVHCHTPVAAACARIACRGLRTKGTEIIYTAHGFHFYKGASLRNWLLYYPVEWLCSFWTDILITINTEDFAFAQKHMHAKRIEYIPGVGIDTNKFSKTGLDRAKKRREIGVPSDCTLLLSVGELNNNKNHKTVIHALSQLNRKDIYYVIAGNGDNDKNLIELATNQGISDQFKLLGYRTDVSELYEISDIYLLPSFREGLNVSLMEAMASGLPCIASKIRGNIDLIKDNDGGYLCNPNDPDAFAKAILNILENKELREKMKTANIEHIKEFDIKKISIHMKKAYGL